MQFTGIGKLISNLEEKTTIEDTDCLITGTSDAKKITWANVFSVISNGIKAKILEWTFTNLGTTNKTIIGAVNELNMKLSPRGNFSATWMQGAFVYGMGLGVMVPRRSGESTLTITSARIYAGTGWQQTEVTNVAFRLNAWWVQLNNSGIDGIELGKSYLIEIAGNIA